MAKHGIGNLFITGLIIVGMLILSGIVSGFIILPLDWLLIKLSVPLWVNLTISIFVGIVVIGYIFTTIRFRRK